MTKKAFLVTFVTTTRVTVDVLEEDEKAWDSIVKEARENILENPECYLYGDNVEIIEDVECPYGEYEGD